MKQLPDRIDESLIVVIAHPLDVSVVALDPLVQFLHELLVLVPIVDSSATKKKKKEHQSRDELEVSPRYSSEALRYLMTRPTLL